MSVPRLWTSQKPAASSLPPHPSIHLPLHSFIHPPPSPFIHPSIQFPLPSPLSPPGHGCKLSTWLLNDLNSISCCLINRSLRCLLNIHAPCLTCHYAIWALFFFVKENTNEFVLHMYFKMLIPGRKFILATRSCTTCTFILPSSGTWVVLSFSFLSAYLFSSPRY